jgi:hypothetical protein
MTNKNRKSLNNYFIGISTSLSLALFLVSGALAMSLGSNNSQTASASGFESPVGNREIIEGVSSFLQIGFLVSLFVSVVFAGITILLLINHNQIIAEGGEL